jgi:hypothetical protein
MTEKPSKPAGVTLPVKLNQAVQTLDLTPVADKVNLLGPRGVVHAGTGLRLWATMVTLSPIPDDEDVYPAIGRPGKLSLSKKGLLTLSSYRGVVWSEAHSHALSDAPPCQACVEVAIRLGRQEPLCSHNVGFKAVAAWLSPAGNWEVHYGTKYWLWDEELAEVQRVYRKQIAEGKLNEAHFDQRVEEEFRKRFRDRLAQVDTKAKLRVVRELGIKAAYTAAELARPFLCVRVEPDTSPEEVRRRGMASASEIFGASLTSLPALPGVDFARATESRAPDEEDENGGDAGQPEHAAPLSAEAAPGPAPPEQPELPAEGGEAVVCECGCGEVLPDNIVAYCQSAKGRKEFGGKNLCWASQGRMRAGVKGGSA